MSERKKVDFSGCGSDVSKFMARAEEMARDSLGYDSQQTAYFVWAMGFIFIAGEATHRAEGFEPVIPVFKMLGEDALAEHIRSVAEQLKALEAAGLAAARHAVARLRETGVEADVTDLRETVGRA